MIAPGGLVTAPRWPPRPGASSRAAEGRQIERDPPWRSARALNSARRAMRRCTRARCRSHGTQCCLRSRNARRATSTWWRSRGRRFARPADELVGDPRCSMGPDIPAATENTWPRHLIASGWAPRPVGDAGTAPFLRSRAEGSGRTERVNRDATFGLPSGPPVGMSPPPPSMPAVLLIWRPEVRTLSRKGHCADRQHDRRSDLCSSRRERSPMMAAARTGTPPPQRI